MMNPSKSVKRYFVFDVETPNWSNDRISSIGFVLIEDDQITKTGEYLVNPEARFHDKNIELTGITPNAVKDAPLFPEVWTKLTPLVDGSILVAHNARFDLGVLEKTAAAYDLALPAVSYLCTMELARDYLPFLSHYKLNNLCDYYGIALNHHQAGSDALGCAKILLHLMDTQGDLSIYAKPYRFDPHPQQRAASPYQPKCSAESAALNELLSLLRAVAADGVLTEMEALVVNRWLQDHQELAGNYPFDRAFTALQEALADNVLEPHELKELLNLFETLANPLACTCDDKECISVAGKQVCLTGDFDHAARKDVENELTNLGAEVRRSVVKKLDYLIVGGQGSDSWVAGNYGTKVKKALELQAAGAGVQIIREADFFAALDRTPVPKQVEPQAKVEEAETEEVTGAISTQMRTLESDFIHALSSFDLNYDTTTIRAEHVITPKSGEYDRLRVVLEGNDLRRPKELTLFRFTGKRKIWVWFPNFICTIFAAAGISYERPDKTPWGRILFTDFPSFDAHESVVQQIFEEAIQGNSFDCCSRYLACSNAKKCIHPDIMMASQCTYRQNLHAGRIFYGENRNV